jgi:hypothetical protein
MIAPTNAPHDGTTPRAVSVVTAASVAGIVESGSGQVPAAVGQEPARLGEPHAPAVRLHERRPAEIALRRPELL